MKINIIIGSQLVLDLLEIKKLQECNAIIKSIERIFSYKNPKFIENEKWGYSNYNTQKYLKSYNIDNNKLFISRGGLEKLEKHLEKFNVKCNFIDRTLVCEPVDFKQSSVIRRSDQQQFINEMLKHNQGCGQAYTAFGKCCKAGTPILMYDGSIKEIQNIKVNDQVMGVDSTPRRVMETCTGNNEMFEVIPFSGDKFTVNGEHILSLGIAYDLMTYGYGKNDIIEMTVYEYLQSPEWLQQVLRLRRPERINFAARDTPKVSPFFKGYQYSISEYRMEPKIEFISDDYKLGSREVRLELLAGIILGNKYTIKHGVIIIFANNGLAKDIKFIAQSLGLACEINGNSLDRQKIRISGCLSIIPLKITKNYTSTSLDHLLTDFKVSSVGYGDYYGFTLDKDKLYLTDDFIINHNTLTALELASELNQPTLVIVHTSFIQEQWIKEALGPFNLDSKDIGGVGGIFGSPKAFRTHFKGQKYEKRRYRKLNICLYHSLQNKEHMDFFKDRIGLVLFDEGQKTPIEAVQSEVGNFRARYRYTVSAEFKRKDGKEFLTFDTFGPIRHIVLERNNTSKILCKINLVKSPTEDYEYSEDGKYSGLLTRLGKNKERNILICRQAVKAVKKGKLVLIFVERKEQAGILAKMLSKFRVDMLLGPINATKIKESSTIPLSVKKILLAYDDKTAYTRIETLAAHKKLDIIIGTQKAEVGLNIRTIDHGIVTTPLGKNLERFKQVKGRIERTYSNEMVKYFGKKKEIPLLDVIVDYNIRPSSDAAEVIKDNWGDAVIRKNKTIIKKRGKQ